jgi:hypothetical protein
MARCQSCNYPLPEDRERLGSRCPDCHDPLYEPPTRFARPSRGEEAACAVHTGMQSVGTCARCGSYLCETCRTRWRGQVWCAACVNRALESGGGTPDEARAHFRQALLSLGLGGGAWLLSTLALFGCAVVVAGAGPGPGALLAGFLFVVIIYGNILVAALGVGQATAALRTRGNHMILATVGLIISGLYVGVLVGLTTFSVWQN